VKILNKSSPFPLDVALTANVAGCLKNIKQIIVAHWPNQTRRKPLLGRCLIFLRHPATLAVSANVALTANVAGCLKNIKHLPRSGFLLVWFGQWATMEVFDIFEASGHIGCERYVEWEWA
jgi:hypothetical protein